MGRAIDHHRLGDAQRDGRPAGRRSPGRRREARADTLAISRRRFRPVPAMVMTGTRSVLLCQPGRLDRAGVYSLDDVPADARCSEQQHQRQEPNPAQPGKHG